MLGVPLFNRRGRGIELTQEGKAYVAPLVSAFELIRTSTPGRSPERSLSVGAFPFVANEVLTPNLGELRSALGGGSIKLHTRTDLELLSHVDPAQRLDVIVRYGRRGKGGGSFPGLLSRRLFDVELLPIAAAGADVPSAAELIAQPLIRVLGPVDGWERWLARYLPDRQMPCFAIETDSFHAAALAVARGEGVCLGVMPYLRPWLEAGRVRALPDLALPIEDGAYAVYAPHNETNEAVDRFVTWLAGYLAAE